MIKGLDNGYAFTKDDQRRIFPSQISYSDQMVIGSKKIVIDGRNYYIGAGSKVVEVDKISSDVNMACTLYNLAITGDTNYFLVVGLPIGHFNAQKDKFRETVLGYNRCKVEFESKEYKFQINDVMVFPQGAATLFTMDKIDNCILIDIGGLTIDVAYITCDSGSPTIKKQNTWYSGMLKLYTDIISAINLKFGIRLETSEAERIMQKGLILRGCQQDLRFLQPKILEFIAPVVDELKLYYPMDTNPIYLCGGGANYLYGAFERCLGQVNKIADAQFSNAIGYAKVGQMKYGKYIKNVG